MSLAMICALLLAAIAALTGLRRLLALRDMESAARPAVWRTVAVILLPMVSAALLYFSLFPPDRQAPAGQLTVLTAHAKTTGVNAIGQVIALPEARSSAGVAQSPDLASVLRQHPGTQSLRILGDGLSARDRESVAGLSIAFESAAVPIGLVEYWQSPVITPGAAWSLRGRINALPNAGIELLDPAGKVVAKAVVDVEGRFILGDQARGPGLSEYRLQIQDAAGRPIESLSVPIAVSVPVPMRILSLSGGPNAEVKALRRWAVDAGAVLDSHIALGPGMVFETENGKVTPARLREVDWLILDERAWDGLSSTEKRAVRDAISGGLGLLLRVTGPLSATATADFGKLGFRIRDVAIVQGIRLPEKTGKPQWPGLNRRPISVQADSAQSILRDSKQQALAVWRASGQGRVGILWLTDSYRLSLAGFPEAHAGVWSVLAASLARARIQKNVQLPDGLLHPNQRVVFCRLGESAQILAADGSQTELIIENMPGRGACAGFWPIQSGWHTLKTGDGRQSFYVHGRDQGQALYRQSLQQATRQLAAQAPESKSQIGIAAPGRHWPYFLAWLLLTSLLWWLERSKIGLNKSGPI